MRIKGGKRIRMSYTRTNHRNALLKLVKDKRMILQVDAQKIMNGHISHTAEKLEQEGKIKRQKVKVRYQNGNLNDAWLLYLPEVKQNEILDYERELINRPFTSPLKENHCYKRRDEVINIEPENRYNSNVIDIRDYVKVNNQELTVKEYNGQRVITFKEIDDVHQRPSGTARKRFNEHKDRFILGEDYFVLNTDEAKKMGVKAPNGLVFITETGYLMIVKTFTDDLAWQVQRQLVNTYFKVKEIKQDTTLQNVSQVQSIQTLDFLELMVKELRNQDSRITNLENKLDNMIKVLSR